MENNRQLKEGNFYYFHLPFYADFKFRKVKITKPLLASDNHYAIININIRNNRIGSDGVELKGLRAIIDTGATSTVLAKNIFDQLNPISDNTTMDGGSMVDNKIETKEVFTIGVTVPEISKSHILPVQIVWHNLPDNVILLGVNFLQYFYFTYNGKNLTFELENHFLLI